MGGVLAGFLALAFTAAMSAEAGPNYSLQPNQETGEQVASHVDCHSLRHAYEFSQASRSRSSEDWQFHRDLWRAIQILECDD